MFECKFCKTTYKRENAFLAHECEPMRRHEEVQTIVGKQAYFMYCSWLQEKHMSRAPTLQSFIDSSYYNSFIRATKFLRAVKVRDIDLYIKMVVADGMPPSMWTMDEVYSKFLQYMARSIPPRDQIRITVRTFIDLADIFECDTANVLDHLSPSELAQIIRERKMSPWILMFSLSFKSWLTKEAIDTQQIFSDLLKPMFWKLRFDKAPQDVAYAREVVKELGI